MPERPLTLRALNRATLARQLLLGREAIPVLDALERLAGLQAQVPRPPFVGLWSRVEGFRREELKRLLAERTVVRGTLMRTTLHVVTAADYLRFRGPLQPALDGALRWVARSLEAVDLPTITEAAREIFAEAPRTFEEVRALLAARFPGVEPRAMGYAARTQLPLVQVPTDDPWAFPASARFTLAEAWLGRRVPRGSAEDLVLRYLAAFGPATAADLQTWSGVGKLDGALAALRPKLVVLRDERGRELLDLPDAPRPPEETPAPVRFLPEYDNLVLSHADRRRVVDPTHRAKLVTKNLLIPATFLVDGFVAGTWRIGRAGRRPKLELAPFGRLARATRDALEAEGARVLAFVEEARGAPEPAGARAPTSPRPRGRPRARAARARAR